MEKLSVSVGSDRASASSRLLPSCSAGNDSCRAGTVAKSLQPPVSKAIQGLSSAVENGSGSLLKGKKTTCRKTGGFDGSRNRSGKLEKDLHRTDQDGA